MTHEFRRASVTAALVAGSPPALSGCEQRCEGAGCEEEFAGALIGVLRGADQPSSGEKSPLDAWTTIAGDKDQGPEADVVLLTGGAWIGTAEDSRVRGFNLGAGGSLRLDEDAVQVIAGEDDADAFGSAIALLPDLDGDGAPELGVGARARDAGAETRDEGSVYVYAGLGSDLEGEQRLLYRVAGEGASGRFGSVLTGCGDLDGGGQPDWASAAPWDSTVAPFAGLAFVGLAELRPTEGAGVLAGEAGLSWTGASRGDRAGNALACAHDLIGADGGAHDGIADLVVGAPFASSLAGEAAGVVYVVPGGTGLQGGPLADRAALALGGADVDAWQGWSVATGDLNGDGLADLAAGAPGLLGQGDAVARGQVVVWDGARLPYASSARARILGQGEGDGFGRALAIADVTGDGLGDLLVGAPRRDPTEDDEQDFESGALYLFYGRESWSGWDTSMNTSDAELRLDTAAAYLRTGQAVRVGDLDGDDLADFALVQRYDPDQGVPE